MLPTLADTCERKECAAFAGGVDVGEGLHVAGAAEMGGGGDVTQLRVLGAPLQTAPAVEITRGARAVLTVTADGGLRAAGRVVSGDARDTTTPADGGVFFFSSSFSPSSSRFVLKMHASILLLIFDNLTRSAPRDLIQFARAPK